MSKPRYRWWSYAINVVEDFVQIPDGSELGAEAYQEWSAVQRAIETTLQLPHGVERCAVMKLVCQDNGKQTLKSAADRIGVTEAVAKIWHRDFMRLVGKELGFSIKE